MTKWQCIRCGNWNEPNETKCYYCNMREVLSVGRTDKSFETRMDDAELDATVADVVDEARRQALEDAAIVCETWADERSAKAKAIEGTHKIEEVWMHVDEADSARICAAKIRKLKETV